MSTRLLVLLLVLLGALVLAIAWLASRPVQRTADAAATVSRTEPGDRVEPAELEPPSAPSVQDAPREPADKPASALETVQAPVSSRQAALTPHEQELREARWVEGRVLLPPGTPADERVFVIARGRDFEHGPPHRAEVGSAGSFRVAFEKKTRSGRLELEARYLHLEKAEPVKLKDVKAPIELRPELGGALAGKLVLPGDSPYPAAELAGKTIELVKHGEDSLHVFGGAFRSVKIGQDLGFEFGGLPAGEYELAFDPGSFVPEQVEGLNVEPGKVRPVDVPLEIGLALSGRTIDDAGRPVPKARVLARSERSGDWSPGRHRTAESDEKGAFQIRGLVPGKVGLQALSLGFDGARLELGTLAERDVREGLELVLRRGHSIAGRVLWPDGTPAAQAWLQVVAEDARDFSRGPDDWREDGFQTAADGSFRITGLDEGSFRVEARAVRVEEVLVKSELTGRERKKKQRTTLRATAEGVAVGTEDLALTLGTGLVVSGRVVDDLGAPVGEFTIVAGRRVQLGPNSWHAEDELARRFESPDGSFELEGFQPGDWEVKASGKGHGESAPARVEVPGPLEVIELVAPRAAIVRGVVLDPDGNRLPLAEILIGQSWRMGWSSRSDERADEEGAFELTELHPGQVELRARHEGRVSAELALELAPGEELASVELRLSRGGSLTGDVRDAQGRALAGREVEVRNWSVDYHETFVTDAAGEFAADEVPPGSCQVTLRASEAELRSVRGEPVDEDVLERREHVVIVAGETAHVTLTPPELEPVRLSGRVVAGKEPLAGANLWFFTQRFNGSPSGETGEDGRYSVTLGRPGSYRVNVWDGSSGLAYSTSLEVPAAASFEYDISFPVGSIAGRVLGPDREPIAGIEVEAQRHEGESWSNTSGQAMTDEEGRYRLRVPAGTYVVTAGGDGAFRKSFENSGRPSFGEACVEDVVVGPEGRVEGIDLVLDLGGTIEGVVRWEDGRAAEDAYLEVLDANDTEIASDGTRRRIRGHGAGAGGRFELEGIAPGTVVVRVRSQDPPGIARAEVQVRAGEVERVELVLRPATWLVIEVLDKSGAEVEAELEVLDEPGRGRQAWLYPEHVGRWWAGPLEPGRYTVRARRGGKQLEQVVTLSSEARRELELVFQ